jgi:hypothetical protein
LNPQLIALAHTLELRDTRKFTKVFAMEGWCDKDLIIRVDLGPKHMDCDYVPEVIVMPEEVRAC